MTKPVTIKQFQDRFPDDDACRDHLFPTRDGLEPVCPKCGQINTFHRLKAMPAYTCNCGHHIHPMAGTPFARTRTPLTTWFHVMFLFCASRNGVSAKEVQRQTGVTYKTAWRMCDEIRKYMGWVDGDRTLGGPGKPSVEVDKMFYGGKDKLGHDDKSVVLGMAERGGDVITRVIPDKSRSTVTSRVAKWVNHSKNEYVRGPVHTNSIESFWSLVKRSIARTHVSVSKKHLQTYLREFEYRYNRRRHQHVMLDAPLLAFPRA